MDFMGRWALLRLWRERRLSIFVHVVLTFSTFAFLMTTNKGDVDAIFGAVVALILVMLNFLITADETFSERRASRKQHAVALAKSAAFAFFLAWILPVLFLPFVAHVAYFGEYWNFEIWNPSRTAHEFLPWILVFLAALATLAALAVIVLVLIHGFVVGATRTLHPRHLFSRLNDRLTGRFAASFLALLWIFFLVAFFLLAAGFVVDLAPSAWENTLTTAIFLPVLSCVLIMSVGLVAGEAVRLERSVVPKAGSAFKIRLVAAVLIVFAFSTVGYARFYHLTSVTVDRDESERIIAEVKSTLPHAPVSENRILGVLNALVDLGLIDKSDEDRFPSEAYDLSAWDGEDGWSDTYRGMSWMDESLPKSAVQGMQELILNTEPFDSAFRQALARRGTGYSYEIDNVSLTNFTKEIGEIVSDVTGLSDYFHFNLARAEVSVLAGRDDEAAAYLRDNLLLSQELLTAPHVLITSMIAWGGLESTLTWLERLSVLQEPFHRSETRWQELFELAMTIKKKALPPVTAVRLELARGVRLMESLKTVRVADLQLIATRDRLPIPSYLAQALGWDAVFRVLYLERQFTFEQKLLRNILADQNSLQEPPEWSRLSVVAQNMTKQLFKSAAKIERDRIRLRLSPFVLAVNAHYREHKNYPEDLSALREFGLEELLPFDSNNPAQRLSYRREGNGFKVLGQGDDGVDFTFDPQESHWPRVE